MKNFNRIIVAFIFVACLSFAADAQMQFPRESQRATVGQTVGDAQISLVYHRPSIKNRQVWGGIVPYGKIWRTGANDATIFETSEDVMINGSKLAAGKYTLWTIPGETEWSVIFNKQTGQWGTVYDEKQNALTVKAKPETAPTSKEAMLFEFDTVTPTQTTLALRWEKLKLPITIDAGNVNARVVTKARQTANNANLQMVNYVITNKITESYPDAMQILDNALKNGGNWSVMRNKARLSAEMGNYKDAVTFGEKALTGAKAVTPPIDADFLANFEKDLATWKTKQ